MKFLFYTFHNFNNLNSWNKIQDRFTFSRITLHSDMTSVWILIFFLVPSSVSLVHSDLISAKTCILECFFLSSQPVFCLTSECGASATCIILFLHSDYFHSLHLFLYISGDLLKLYSALLAKFSLNQVCFILHRLILQ